MRKAPPRPFMRLCALTSAACCAKHMAYDKAPPHPRHRMFVRCMPDNEIRQPVPDERSWKRWEDEGRRVLHDEEGPPLVEPQSGLQVGDPAPAFSTIAVGGKYGDGQRVSLSDFAGGIVVLYFYPKDDTPGCTTQACGLRDAWTQFAAMGAEIFGVSIDPVKSHRSFIDKFSLPFPLLSDAELAFASAMRLPLFDVGPMRLLKRLTLIICDGAIEHVFYPVFPPDRNADQVLDWLRAHR